MQNLKKLLPLPMHPWLGGAGQDRNGFCVLASLTRRKGFVRGAHYNKAVIFAMRI